MTVDLVVSVAVSGRGPLLWGPEHLAPMTAGGPPVARRASYPSFAALPADLWEAFAAGDARLTVCRGDGLLATRTVYLPTYKGVDGE